MKELRGIIKDKGGEDLGKGVLDTFGEKPDGVLLRFIRARKYDVNRAYELMKGKARAITPPVDLDREQGRHSSYGHFLYRYHYYPTVNLCILHLL